MRVVAGLAAAFFLYAGLQPAAAQNQLPGAAAQAAASASNASDQWREFRSEQDSFLISLPGTPTISARRIPNSESTQTNFLVERGEIAFLVSVITFPAGGGPKSPDEAYFKRLVDNYAEGSRSKLRSTRTVQMAGYPGMEGLTDGESNVSHMVDVTAIADRVYLLVYVGVKGQEQGADAVRFRDSFKLIPK